MIVITPSLSIDEKEIEEKFIRASGPGGQKVNKTECAVQIRFNALASPSLSHDLFLRLKKLAGRRMTQNGVIVITANRYRSQDKNRQDAINRLIAMIQLSEISPRYRRPTKPTKMSIKRRLDNKNRQSKIKKERAKPSRTDESVI